MSTENKNIAPHNASSQEKRNDLLSELESIRNLLGDENPNDTAVGHIPLLIPNDSIPTLGPEHRHHDHHARRTSKSNKTAMEKNLPATTQTFFSSTRSREKLVDDVVRSAMPRLESLLRELVQEALLQEKLRGGKR